MQALQVQVLITSTPYLRTFYRDDTKLTGWNNLGSQRGHASRTVGAAGASAARRFEEHESHGQKTHVLRVGSRCLREDDPAQYDAAIGDLVNYMQWMAEPAQNTRIRVGVWVLIFLGFFTVIAWRLNAAFWKDVK